MQYPICIVPGGVIRLDHITHLTTVEDQPQYVELFFLNGHRAVYHRDDIQPVLAWFEAQAQHFAHVQHSLPPPCWDTRLETHIDAAQPVTVPDEG